MTAAGVVVVPRKVNMRSAASYCPESIWKVTEALWMGRPIVAVAVRGFIDAALPIKVAPLEKSHEAVLRFSKKHQESSLLSFHGAIPRNR